MSVRSRIERLEGILGAPEPLPEISDLELAKTLCHCLSCMVVVGAGDRVEAMPLARCFSPDDPDGWLDAWIASWRADSERRNAERCEQYPTRVGSTLDEYQQYMRPTAVPTVPRSVPEFCSPEWEQQRVDRVTAIKPERQERAFMGGRAL